MNYFVPGASPGKLPLPSSDDRESSFEFVEGPVNEDGEGNDGTDDPLEEFDLSSVSRVINRGHDRSHSPSASCDSRRSPHE